MPASPVLASVRPSPRDRSRTQIRLARATTAVAATAAAVAGWTIAVPVAGVTLSARSGAGQPAAHVGLAAVIAAGLLAGLAGWALLAVLERFTARARGVWTVCALVVLVLSLAGPASAPTTSAAIALGCLHLITGSVLISGLRRSAARP